MRAIGGGADGRGPPASWWGKRDSLERYIARVTPGRSGDQEFTRLLASYLRLSARPTTRVKLHEMGLAIDVREALSTIRAPTLVIHRDPPRRRADDESTANVFDRPVEASRYVAERIPGARFVELTPGDPPVWAIDQREPLELLRGFLMGAWEAGAWEPAEPDRVLATLLFTDIVGSTEVAAELGERAGATWYSVITRSCGNSSSAFADVR